MSMTYSTLSTARHNPNRIQMALMLAHNIQQGREALGLSVSEAAYLSGMEVSRWCALEGGWVPADDDSILRSLAETLEVNYLQVSLLAAISRHNQLAR